MCKPIPAGYYANANTAATTITPCALGTVSYWTDATTRVPATSASDTCQSCADFGVNTYAPRTGMANCLPCKGGSIPSKSNVGLAGADQCSDCTANTYRSFYTTS